MFCLAMVNLMKTILVMNTATISSIKAKVYSPSDRFKIFKTNTSRNISTSQVMQMIIAFFREDPMGIF